MGDCGNIRALIEEQFAQQSAMSAAVREHLAGCEDCAQHYDRLYSADAALGGGELSAVEKELIFARVLPAATKKRSWARMTAPYLAALGLAGGAAAVLLVAQPDDGFGTRGGEQTAGDAGAVSPNDLGLRVFCLVPKPGGGLGARSLTADGAGCETARALGFAYRNRTGSDRFLQIAVQWRGAEREQIYPPPGAEGRIPAGGDETPIEASFQIEGGSQELAVFALFSEAALPRGAVLAAAAGDTPAGAILRQAAVKLPEAP